MKTAINRHSLVENGLTAAGVGFLAGGSSVLADDEHAGPIARGDAALLRFAAAAEILETDFWVQYPELGGIPILPPAILSGYASIVASHPVMWRPL
jgi:hypothetical protein